MKTTVSNPSADRTILLCSCEDTMRLDAGTVAKGCADGRLVTARQLCGSELDLFRKHGAAGRTTVACTAQRALFEQVAADDALGADFSFANVRENAGWSTEGERAAPKMAALLAIAEVAAPAPVAVTFESDGVALLYGPGDVVIAAAEALKSRLDVTVLISDDGETSVPFALEYPIFRGRIRTVKGHLGAFEIVIDKMSALSPSSRRRLTFGRPRDGAISNADLLIDLSGAPALLTAADLREGYLRGDPRDPLAVSQLLLRASDLVGTFDKPRYVTFDADLCAHSRSRKVGCTRCLDLCPAGAITPDGDHVAIDPYICGGCGQCAAACPTGAATYAMPAPDLVLQMVRAGARAYAAAGGSNGTLLIHDRAHGGALIETLARLGDGLPATCIPLEVNEVTQVGLETVLAAITYGYRSVRLLTRDRPRHDIAGLERTVEIARTMLDGLGFADGSVALVQTDDPDELAAAMSAIEPAAPHAAVATFLPLGGKRDLLKMALRELHRRAPAPRDRIELPAGAAMGGLTIDTGNCTLCLSCVSACPTSALGDAADRPLLSFDESLCVQCGLCAATCPEKVIALAPRIDFEAFTGGRTTVKEEEPFHCITCGKAFGVKSTIERVVAKLQDKHWMFRGDGNARIDLIRSCDDCRVTAMTNSGFDPYAATPRPPARTTEDYLREREAAMKAKIENGEA